MMTFQEYRKEKSKQWHGYTSNSGSKKQKATQPSVQDVVISIGLMEWREKEAKLMCKRGKRISLRVPKTAKKQEIRILAENKWKQFHPDIYNEEDLYTLLYESGEEVETLPGSNEEFALNSYQVAVGKDFKTITLFLCKYNDMAISNLDFFDTCTNENDSGPDSKVMKVWTEESYEPPCIIVNKDSDDSKAGTHETKKAPVAPLTSEEVFQLIHSEVMQESHF